MHPEAQINGMTVSKSQTTLPQSKISSMAPDSQLESFGFCCCCVVVVFPVDNRSE